MADKIYQINTKINSEYSFLWQYDSAEKMKKIIENLIKFDKINVDDFFRDFYKDVFNVGTANNFGLLVWGSLLGVTRPKYKIASGIFVDFTDDMYRVLLAGRLMLYNSNASVANLNNYFKFLFPNKLAYIVNYYDMSLRIVFYYNPTFEELGIIFSDGFLPLPSGVLISDIIVPPGETFGFLGSELAGFGQGTFVNFA